MRGRIRALLGFAAGLWLVARMSPVAGATVPLTDGEINEWLEWLTPPRYPGDDAHQKLIDHLEEKLQELRSGDGSIKIDPQSRPFTRWDPVEPELEGENLKSDSTKIWPLPYSGFTSPAGVTAPLHYEGWVSPFFHFNRKQHAGKIVVLRIRPCQMRVLLWAVSRRAIPFWRHSHPGSYRRAISLEVQVPSLGEARRAGVVGLIVVIGGPPELAVDQYVPFTRGYEDLPAVFVERNLGKAVIAAAKRKERVTLRHPGSLNRKATTAHLLATLPATNTLACPTDGQAIVIGTHTDGPNLFEDNGVIALWALLRELAKEPCRPRDLVFTFAAAHFAHEPGSTDDILRRNPELFARTRAALVIEHLGALRSLADGKSAGQAEPTLLMRTAHDRALERALNRVVKQHAKAEKALRPIYFVRPWLFKFGEGKFLAEKGIPTIGYMPNPSYLLSEESGHAKWFCPSLMRKQIDMFRDLIDALMLLEPLTPQKP